MTRFNWTRSREQNTLNGQLINNSHENTLVDGDNGTSDVSTGTCPYKGMGQQQENNVLSLLYIAVIAGSSLDKLNSFGLRYLYGMRFSFSPNKSFLF